jgi:GMP synthase-like glutamine amidotransferase
MRVLILQHHPDEGPGSLGPFLADQGAELVYVHCYAGQSPPTTPEGYDAIVSMGGPMNVYEEEEHPWLVPENELLARAARAGVPILGFCLGAQLIAKALGARVVRSPAEEIGWCTVRRTLPAAHDPLFQDLPDQIPVLQWHGDMFMIPDGALLLASGQPCPHQAFVWRRAYGLQFHLEVTPEMLQEWFEDDPRLEEVMAGWQEQGAVMDQAAQALYRGFWRLAAGDGA